jgi:hypothetical protein
MMLLSKNKQQLPVRGKGQRGNFCCAWQSVAPTPQTLKFSITHIHPTCKVVQWRAQLHHTPLQLGISHHALVTHHTQPSKTSNPQTLRTLKTLKTLKPSQGTSHNAHVTFHPTPDLQPDK